MARTVNIDSDVTLYLGDCRELLDHVGVVDAIVSDPPYGIGYIPRKKSSTARVRETEASYFASGRGIVGDDAVFDPTIFLEKTPHALFWGANYFADRLPPVPSWIIWDKMGGNAKHHGTKTFADCELAWCSDGRPARIHQQIWSGLIRQGSEATVPRRHPNEKPIELMMACVARFPDAITILDPFMGSGPTGVACVRQGKKFVGIEIEPKYFDVAYRRIEDAARQRDMFVAPIALLGQQTPGA